MLPILGGAARLKIDPATTNVVCDGNSLVAGFGTTTANAYPAQMAAMAPFNGLARVVNVGVSGQQISGSNSMRSRRAASVDANYQAGKLNLLYPWEATNTIWVGGKTGAQAGAEMKLYCIECLNVHPDWVIAIPTTIPRYNTNGAYGADLDAANAQLRLYNEYIKDNMRDMGARKIIDLRASGLFEYTGPTMSPALATYIYDLIHLTVPGYGLIAQMMAAGSAKLPRR